MIVYKRAASTYLYVCPVISLRTMTQSTSHLARSPALSWPNWAVVSFPRFLTLRERERRERGREREWEWGVRVRVRVRVRERGREREREREGEEREGEREGDGEREREREGEREEREGGRERGRWRERERNGYAKYFCELICTFAKFSRHVLILPATHIGRDTIS